MVLGLLGQGPTSGLDCSVGGGELTRKEAGPMGSRWSTKSIWGDGLFQFVYQFACLNIVF
jgi:hypothetical protein